MNNDARVERYTDDFGVQVVVCGCPEVLCNSLSTDQATKEEIAAAVREEVSKVLCYQLGIGANFDDSYAHWRGGRHGFADVVGKFVVACLFRFEVSTQKWERVGREGFPPRLLEQVEAAIRKVDASIRQVLACGASARVLNMRRLLRCYGDYAHGGDTWSAASEWARYFRFEEARDWLDVGFWDAEAANALRSAGITPDELAGREDMVYAVCNGDLATSTLVAAVREGR